MPDTETRKPAADRFNTSVRHDSGEPDAALRVACDLDGSTSEPDMRERICVRVRVQGSGSGSGRTLLPSLWDVHAHIFPSAGLTQLARGGTDVREAKQGAPPQ